MNFDSEQILKPIQFSFTAYQYYYGDETTPNRGILTDRLGRQLLNSLKTLIYSDVALRPRGTIEHASFFNIKIASACR